MTLRSYKSLKAKLMKVQTDIKFNKFCKIENFILTLNKVNIKIKSSSRNIKLSLAKIIMEAKMENKHREKRRLRKEIVAISNKLKGAICLFLYNMLVRNV